MSSKIITFSQSSLQDFVECPRRFQLRHLEGQAWPGVVAEPALAHEQYLERGAQFHRLVERHQLGMDSRLLQSGIVDPQVQQWWDAYLSFQALHQREGRRYPEFSLSAGIAGSRVMAVYDLLLVVPDERIVIYDWKTYARTPTRQWLQARLQTRVYLSVLVKAGRYILGREVIPADVSLVYWVAGSGESVEFEYSYEAYEQDLVFIEGLMDQVRKRSELEVWSLTSDVSRCGFCVYRSLCGRGREAEKIESNEADNIVESGFVVGFGLSDVEEIGF